MHRVEVFPVWRTRSLSVACLLLSNNNVVFEFLDALNIYLCFVNTLNNFGFTLRTLLDLRYLLEVELFDKLVVLRSSVGVG